MNRLAQITMLVQRVSMLIGGGVQPARVWQLLSEDAQVAPYARTIAEHVNARRDIPGALSAAGLNIVAALWRVAQVAGAPMADALNSLAKQLESMRHSQHAHRIAFAAPRATMRLVLLLPLIGVGFAMLLGFNTLEVLLLTPVGWCITAVGVVLLLAGYRWSIRMMAKAATVTRLPGYVCELMAVALTGGSSVASARLNVTDALVAHPVQGALVSEIRASTSAVCQAIAIAEAAGVSVVDVLRAQAEAERADDATSRDEAAARLGVRLMLPLGVCILPAFIVLTVLPMMLAIFRQSTIS